MNYNTSFDITENPLSENGKWGSYNMQTTSSAALAGSAGIQGYSIISGVMDSGYQYASVFTNLGGGGQGS